MYYFALYSKSFLLNRASFNKILIFLKKIYLHFFLKHNNRRYSIHLCRDFYESVVGLHELFTLAQSLICTKSLAGESDSRLTEIISQLKLSKFRTLGTHQSSGTAEYLEICFENRKNSG